MSFAIALGLMLQGGSHDPDQGLLADLVGRLDDSIPEVRDKAEEELRRDVSRWVPWLLQYLDDGRLEVRTRVGRVLKLAPTASIVREIAAENPLQVGRAALLLTDRLPAAAMRPAQAGDLTLFPLCREHASPFEIARELGPAITIVPLETAWKPGCLLEIPRGRIQLDDLRNARRPPILQIAERDGVLAIGSESEIEAWRKRPPSLPLLALLGSSDAHRRELGARFLGSRADDDTFAALVDLAARSAAAREAVVWGSPDLLT